MQNKLIILLAALSVFLSSFVSAKTFTFFDKSADIEKKGDGTWDYDHVRVSYSNGDSFYGKVDSKLNILEGEYSNKQNKFTYTGTFNTAGQANGRGKKVLKDGTILDGNWVNGDFKGYGKKICSDGSRIEGYFTSETVVTGKDSYIQWKNGASYRGETDSSGVFNGKGKFKFADGTIYEGSFVDNNRTGFGKTTYNGSTYTGYYYGDVRNGNGDFEFYNGYEYKGHFYEGEFNGTGYLLTKEDENAIYASDDWKDARIPDNGRIIFEDGLVWEGAINNGSPVLGGGIWTTQEERLAKLSEKKGRCEFVSYSLDDKQIIVASVYTPEEVQNIIHSAGYIRSFDNYYKAHKSTFDKVIKGMQAVAGVLAIIPSPIQPFAIAASVALSAVNISLKTMDAAFDVYDAMKAGNKSLIKDIAVNYGKDIAFDIINIILLKAVPAGLENVLRNKGLAKMQIDKIVQGAQKVGAFVSATTATIIAGNTQMKKVEQQLRNLKSVKELADSQLIQQGRMLRANYLYPDVKKDCVYII